ncbi:MAG TPA: hypothetical protein VD794_04385 [Flavisolibacter sp.]|nr:hypothetical protein [Flavisolibacter sp.]
MEKEPAIQDQFRKLDIELPPIRQENNLFWWLAGIALALCVVALTLHYYVLYKQQRQQPTPERGYGIKQPAFHKEALHMQGFIY